ncbi:nucleotide-binding protein [Pedobacter panaciterrae]|uniref:Nucleotide-binding protein n=1 Tax=Pedobacter panaciterrae TaxID=363849 RepID=A0ABU8NI43_9SPHI
MAKFKGGLSALQSLLGEHKIDGTWSEIPNGYKFITPDGAVLSLYNTETILSQGKGTSKGKIDALIRNPGAGEAKLIPTESKPEVAKSPQLFVVYGHDQTSRDQLELILSKLGIEPFILAKSSGEGLTIIEALERHLGTEGTANVGIVLLTPDDLGYAKRDGEGAIKERARQNVILEMGMLISKLGRQNTLILVKGRLERPSDTDGIIYHSFTDHVKEVGLALVERLERSGFPIDHKRALDAIR